MPADGDVVDHAGREACLLAVDAHQRAFEVGAHHQGARGRRQRQELELHRRDPVGRHLDRDPVGRVAGRGDGEDMRAGDHAGAALRQLERRRLSFEAQL